MKCLNCGINYEVKKGSKRYKWYCSKRCYEYLYTIDTLQRVENLSGRFISSQTKRWRNKAAKTLRGILENKYNEHQGIMFVNLGKAQYRPKQNRSKYLWRTW